MNHRPLEPTETETMNQPQDRASVYNDYPVRKESVPQPRQPEPRGLSPRAKAGIAAGGVVLAATGMIAWSQYETGQTNASVAKAQLALEQERLDLQIQQQENQAAKASSQETAAQKARREAVEKCVAAAGNSYNGVADCAQAYPAVDSTGALTSSQSVASATPTNGSSSGVGLVVLGGVGIFAAGGWAKKRLFRQP
jgi:hypothetical protein